MISFSCRLYAVQVSQRVEQGGEDHSTVDFELGIEADSSSLPDFLPQSHERAACLGDSVVDLSVNVHIASACAAKCLLPVVSVHLPLSTVRGTACSGLAGTLLPSSWC